MFGKHDYGRIAVAGAFIVLILVIADVAYNRTQQTYGPAEEAEPDQPLGWAENVTARPVASDAVLYGRALNESSLELCEDVVSAELRYACKSIVADDPTYCYGVRNRNFVEKCTSRYYYSSAFAKNDYRGCLRVGDAAMHDSCLMKFVVKTGNKRLCGSLIDAGVKSSCESRTSRPLA